MIILLPMYLLTLTNSVSFLIQILPSVKWKNDAEFPYEVFWELQMKNALKELRILIHLYCICEETF